MFRETSSWIAGVSGVLHSEFVLAGLSRAGDDLVLIQIESWFAKGISNTWLAWTR